MTWQAPGQELSSRRIFRLRSAGAGHAEGRVWGGCSTAASTPTFQAAVPKGMLRKHSPIGGGGVRGWGQGVGSEGQLPSTPTIETHYTHTYTHMYRHTYTHMYRHMYRHIIQ